MGSATGIGFFEDGSWMSLVELDADWSSDVLSSAGQTRHKSETNGGMWMVQRNRKGWSKPHVVTMWSMERTKGQVAGNKTGRDEKTGSRRARASSTTIGWGNAGMGPRRVRTFKHDFFHARNVETAARDTVETKVEALTRMTGGRK